MKGQLETQLENNSGQPDLRIKIYPKFCEKKTVGIKLGLKSPQQIFLPKSVQQLMYVEKKVPKGFQNVPK